MRLTRAALRAEATRTHDNETADASNLLPPTPSTDRIPLGEVSANAVAELSQGHPNLKNMAPKKAKSKVAKKAAKGNKARKAQASPPGDEREVEVLEDERRAAGSPASDAAVDELAKAPADDIVVQVPMNDQRPASPPSRAVRMTRRQLARVEELSKSQRVPLPSPQLHLPAAEGEIANAPSAGPEEETVPDVQKVEAVRIEQARVKPESGVAVPAVEVIAEPEPKTLTSEKPCEGEATPVTSRSPSRSPSKSPAKVPMRLEESIEAIDALEEAIEQVGKAIPVFDHEADEKSPRKARFDAVPTPNMCAAKVSKTPTAPKSLKPTTSNVSKGATSRPSISRSASTRVAPPKNADVKVRKGSGEVVDYLASKRRPISMSFPVPPPPPKSVKPPTKSTFHLPGEAVAAKLKAQKEERLKREEDEAVKKAAFKARPAPARKNVPAPVRQTAASKARENLMNGKPTASEKESKMDGASIPLKRTNSINSGKRLSTTITSSRLTFTTSTSSSPSSNRNSTIVNPGPVTKSTVTAADAVAQRLKAREIFNRDKLEKERRENERREKEEAAKRARAEAAERGRIASREWAEKQRMKKQSASAPATKVETT
ncbi:uncharacterized protein BDR25DRAFT_313564 [Lindgomyces ingoldianus]|uniref:Uncharacterized protein n=1 Tax=Lindgomyces ingoldianus TaxID=673940 RepID=A0ACB6QXT9_9PLEO|nr:uncharacterized protein BDR25DRAFT_313564 [Lindgomyces ingoldianus]KAF2471632.1 hypothetical protein BDR25DRAFT_313564 [Lindgomyces ingoldianus]